MQALRQMNLQGVLVLDVPPGTPAARAGMQGIVRDGDGRLVIGDVITGLNGKAVRKEADLFDALDDCKVGGFGCGWVVGWAGRCHQPTS